MKDKIRTTYKKLNEIEHVLLRPGRYLGTVAPTENFTFVIDSEGKIKWGAYKYSPAFVKIFDEIISNSADFSKREEGKHLNKIEVNIDRATGEISVYDNGGIPVVKHPDYDQYIPEMIFGELRAGSNFNDEEDSVSTGQNGEGATLTNIFSKKFTVDTADGKNRFVTTYYDNLSKKDESVVKKCNKSYTKITYLPDYERFGINLDDDNYLMLVRRTYEIAATNPHISVYLNGNLLKIRNFYNFCELFSSDRVDFGHDRFQVSVFHSKEGFQHISYINSTCVSQGGTHIDYVMNQIINSVREYVKKKTKQDVKPSDIKNHFFLCINATINNPRYNSQTKEKLETAPKDYGTILEVDQKTIKKIINSDIVKEIIQWAENKQKLEELAALKKKNKDLEKNSLKTIAKYETATSKNRQNCILFISEGDSAGKALQSARDPEIHGIYPLKGKPLNVRGMKIKDLVENKELSDLMKILGLQFGVKHKISDLRYKRLVIATDQDLDGFHLCGLIINMFSELWPDLVKDGFLYKLNTPIIRATLKNKELEFFSMEEFKEWDEKNETSKYQISYLKGLGSNDTKYFKNYMFQEKYMIPITLQDDDDLNSLKIAFDKSMSDERKKFIYGE